MAKHGRAVYWKGVANKHLHYPSIGKAHEKVIESVKSGQFQAAVLYEYFPLNKVNDVPQSATAFRREAMVNNVLINVNWDRNAQDFTQEARQIAHQISDILNTPQADLTTSESLGYSNYGNAFYMK